MNAEVKSEMDRIFGSILKQYRIKNNYTQAEMGEKLAISEKYVSRIETGTGGISKETLAKYMNLLSISPNTMYKEFISNPKVKQEIQITEKISKLSTEKLAVIMEIVNLLESL